MAPKTQQDRKDHFSTDSGIDIDRIYSKRADQDEDAGTFPFTRGIHPNMYRSKFWTMRQYAGFSTAEESNKRYHYLISQGTTGLSVAFDLPTQIGYDSDDAMADGEVGRVGVAIDSIKDMEALLKDISLEDISTSMTINSTASILLALYIAVAKKQGVDLNKLRGTVQNDILKEYAARGTYIYPPDKSMRLVTDVFDYCSEHMPKWNTISISGYHMREAGANAVQELAFTLSNAKAYTKAAIEKGLNIDIFAKRLSFFFNSHNNLFEEIAKFRAARRMWAKITKDLGATDERAQMLRFHAQTAGSSLTAQQPKNNIVRVTLQALAAVLGGTQSLHTNGYDEALSLPTEEAASIAIRTQQIIAYESGAADTVDPIGGSYFIESMTSEIEKAAWDYIERIDSMGGAVAAIEQGFFQNEIAASAYKYQSDIESKEKIIVGVNKFEMSEKEDQPIFQIDQNQVKDQIENLKKFKASRDNTKVQASLNALKECAKSENNIMPNIIEAVEIFATLGEISNVLRSEFGEYKGS